MSAHGATNAASSSPLGIWCSFETILLSGPETSLEQVQTLLKEHPELLHVGFQGSAFLLAIQQKCPEDVILYLLHRSFPEGHVSPLVRSSSKDDDDHRSGSFWKIFILAAMDETRHVSRPVVWAILNTFPQWIDCYSFLGHDLQHQLQHHDQHDQNHHRSSGSGRHLLCGVMVWRPDVARDMIQRYPHLAHPQPHVSFYPLHAAARQQDRRIMEVLLEVFPQGLVVKDNAGRLPLHHVLMLNSETHVDLDLFQWLVQRMPLSFFQDAQQVESGRLFLHQLVLNSDNWWSMDGDMVQAVLDRNPEAAMTPDANGMLPIHLLLDCDDEAYHIVQRLIQAAPESLLMADGNGRLPLHLAVSKFMILSAQDMIETMPCSIRVCDRQGQTPLHTMLDTDMFDKSTAERMVYLYPEILLIPDSQGKVPLHYAVDECQYFEDIDWLEAVELLTRVCPQAALLCDVSGKTPLHYAVTTGTPHSVLETLLRTSLASAATQLSADGGDGRDDDALWIPDLEGNIPLFCAANAVYRNPDHCLLSTVYLLVRHEPARLLSILERARKTTIIMSNTNHNMEDTNQMVEPLSLLVPKSSSRKRKLESIQQ